MEHHTSNLLYQQLSKKLQLEVLNIKKMETRDILNKMYVDNDLCKEDIHKHQHYTIIKRSGIEKIQSKNNIQVSFELEHIEKSMAVVKATAIKGEKVIETFGSASNDTSHNKYYTEMAEKRALSRAILKMMGLYKYNVYGEDESDDFKQSENK